MTKRTNILLTILIVLICIVSFILFIQQIGSLRGSRDISENVYERYSKNFIMNINYSKRIFEKTNKPIEWTIKFLDKEKTVVETPENSFNLANFEKQADSLSLDFFFIIFAIIFSIFTEVLYIIFSHKRPKLIQTILIGSIIPIFLILRI